MNRKRWIQIEVKENCKECLHSEFVLPFFPWFCRIWRRWLKKKGRTSIPCEECIEATIEKPIEKGSKS